MKDIIKDIADWLQTDAGPVVKSIIYIVIVAAATLIVVMIAKKLFRKWIRIHENRGSKEQTISFIKLLRSIVVVLICFGGVMAVIGRIPGLNQIATSLLAGSGIAAVALSVAAQSSVGNLVSGVLLGLFKPIRVGDTVRYLGQDITGIVEEITLRHTIIRTWENKRLIVPNSTMNTEVIENASFGSDPVCLFLELEVSYESDLDLALKILQEHVLRHPKHIDVRTEAEKSAGVPEVKVRVEDFNESGILLRAFLWAADVNVAAYAKSDILRSVKKEYEEKGIEIPYPHRTVIMRREPVENGETGLDGDGN